MRRKLIGGLALGVAGALCVTALVVAQSSNSPVADAARQGDRATVQALLKQGADVNAAQADGITALHWAAMNGDAAMAAMLLYAGANVGASTRLGSLTPLDLAAKTGRADVIGALLKGGANPNRADAHGTTPLMLAAASGSVPAVTALLDAGAHVNAKESTKDETALMFGAAFGRADVVKVLLAHGADWRPNSRVFDWRTLHDADPRFYRAGATLDEKDSARRMPARRSSRRPLR